MRTFLLAALLVSVPPAMGQAPADGFRKLTGPQIKSAFSGHTFSDDVHFSLNYRATGIIDGTGMGRKVSRKWRVEGHELCQTEDSGENCFSIWRKGQEVRFVVGDDLVFTEGRLR